MLRHGAVSEIVSYWGDQLTKYGNSTITYDEIGNPIYMGGDTYEWEGRKLISRYDDYEYFTYTYNADGIRISKEYGEFDYHQYRHEYTLNGSQIVKETVYYNEYGDSGFVEDYTLVYIYDETGSPIGMKYREPSYAGGVYDVFFFEKNLQGDIVSVYNSSGVKLIAYTYDAWGNFTQTYVGGTQAQIFTAQKNPFRYRGYYYDSDTGLYYLQSRYYNPQWGRFLNADLYLGTGGFGGYNLFAYCSNNPVVYIDPNGEFAIMAIIVGSIIGAAIGFGATAYVDYKDDGEIFNGSVSAIDYVSNTLVGGTIGALTGGIASSSLTLTMPTLHAALTTAGNTVLIAGTTTITITGVQIIGVSVAAAGILFLANRSGKEMSSDKPSWANKDMVDPNKTPQQNATDMLDNKYGRGNWSKGAGSEFSKIVKWITRKIFFER